MIEINENEKTEKNRKIVKNKKIKRFSLILS